MHASGNNVASTTPAPTPTQPPALTPAQHGPPAATVPYPNFNMPQYYHPNMTHGPPQANPAFNVGNPRRHFEDVGYENMGQEVFHQN